jgi:hypothetical protein
VIFLLYLPSKTFAYDYQTPNLSEVKLYLSDNVHFSSKTYENAINEIQKEIILKAREPNKSFKPFQEYHSLLDYFKKLLEECNNRHNAVILTLYFIGSDSNVLRYNITNFVRFVAHNSSLLSKISEQRMKPLLFKSIYNFFQNKNTNHTKTKFDIALKIYGSDLGPPPISVGVDLEMEKKNAEYSSQCTKLRQDKIIFKNVTFFEQNLLQLLLKNLTVDDIDKITKSKPYNDDIIDMIKNKKNEK